jgi:hypothetical protein
MPGQVRLLAVGRRRAPSPPRLCGPDAHVPANVAHTRVASPAAPLSAADGAFYSGKNEAAAKAKGVKRLRWVGLGVISDNLNSIVVNTANL